MTFEPNKDYVRQVLADADRPADRRHSTTCRSSELPADHRYFRYQATVNAGGAPSEQVIDEDRAKRGREYRDETEGEHPDPDLRPAGMA